MNKIITYSVLAILLVSCRHKPDPEYVAEITRWQDQMDQEFAYPESSPLTEEGLQEFEGIEFFSIDDKYHIVAEFVATPYEDTFGMETTTERRPLYKKFGEAYFKLDGKELKLDIFQNQELLKIPEYKDYLFIPFKDKTNGVSSYHGGRYLEATIPDGETIEIDFNYAYNPYCAYNHQYSCPIPPAQNYLNVEIKAGVKDYKGK